MLREWASKVRFLRKPCRELPLFSRLVIPVADAAVLTSCQQLVSLGPVPELKPAADWRYARISVRRAKAERSRRSRRQARGHNCSLLEEA